MADLLHDLAMVANVTHDTTGILMIEATDAWLRLKQALIRLEMLEKALHKLTDEPVTDTDNAGEPMCAYCGGWTPTGEIVHDIGCVWEAARKLVAE